MNEDFENMFSMRGAYVDDDGTEIGSNDVLGPTPSRKAILPSQSSPESTRRALSGFVVGALLGICLLTALILWLR